MEKLLRKLELNPIIPAVRTEGESLEKALCGDHPAIFVFGGDVFKLISKIETEESRPPIFVNVDLIGGVAGDATGIGFLSQHVEGVISTSRRVIELANSTDLITIQRLFAIDAMAMERGVKLIKRTKPKFVEIVPALAYPRMASGYSELLNRPVLTGGFVRSMEEVSFILDAGAVGVSSSHQALWKGALDSKVRN